MSSDRGVRDFEPAAPWRNIRLRAQLRHEIRHFFETRGFLEVDTPALSADTVIDRHLDPLNVVLFEDARRPDQGPRRFLQTSPEFHMKRLLASRHAPPAIYQIARAFRGGEQGDMHNPEFTLVEWYNVGDSYEAGIDLLDELSMALFGRGPAERLSYSDAFVRQAQVDPMNSTDEQVIAAYRRVSPNDSSELTSSDRDALLDLVMCELVQPRLGLGRPTILTHYPASQAALAKTRREGEHEVAERFELFVDGIELANGYHELLDAEQLCRRNSEANRLRDIDGKPRLPESSRLISAMRHGLPNCCGAALGFDRTVMLRAGADSLGEVMPFPADRA